MQTAELMLAFPEIILLAGACLLLVFDTFSRDPDRNFTYLLAQVLLVITAWFVVDGYSHNLVHAFGGSFVSDPMSSTLKVMICIITFIVFLYSHEYLKKHNWVKGEYYVLGLFAVLGMMVMVSAGSLLTVYLGLELLSLSLYAMVAMQRDSGIASEAAMKYFVLGALASGMLLYGISILYGVTGTLQLNELAVQLSAYTGNNMVLVFALVFIIIGVAFKLGAVPFHMWVPDVYHGAPTSVTLFIGSAPKIAAFAMAIRLLVDGMEPLLNDWRHMLVILAILSMATGNIVAIAQTNLKRMLAYSTISHIGFMLLGILAGTETGYAAAMFYIVTYALMSTGAFGMIILLSRHGFESDNLEDFKGLAEKNQWFAFIMLILMFSMTGVPPFLGFWAKWFVLKEVVDMGYVWLAALAVVFSIIGAYYYLRVIKLMYFDKADNMTAIRASLQMRLALSLNGLALLVIGLVPGVLMSLCLAALVK